MQFLLVILFFFVLKESYKLNQLRLIEPMIYTIQIDIYILQIIKSPRLGRIQNCMQGKFLFMNIYAFFQRFLLYKYLIIWKKASLLYIFLDKNYKHYIQLRVVHIIGQDYSIPAAITKWHGIESMSSIHINMWIQSEA